MIELILSSSKFLSIGSRPMINQNQMTTTTSTYN
jgi:hypothetical protein